MMKIMIVTSGFFPGKKYGGPPVSINNFCSLLDNEEIFIITHDHDFHDTKRYPDIHEGWNNRNNCKVLYLSNAEYCSAKFEQAILEISPDLLYLQSLFQSCIVPCLKLAHKYRIKVLLAPRGELCKGAISIKKSKKMAYIFFLRMLRLTNNIHFHSTSDEETNGIKQWLGAKESSIHQIENIPSVPLCDFPEREKKKGEGHFVFLSRIHPKKNLLFGIRCFSKIKGNSILHIYGPIEDSAYWAKCQEAARNLPDNVKVEYCGVTSHDQVHEIFSRYDAFLFPTLSENYGHVIAESLTVGTPVIISDQTPWNFVNSAKAGWAIDLKKQECFSNAIQTIVDYTNEEQQCIRNAAKKCFSDATRLTEIKLRYIKMLEDCVK